MLIAVLIATVLYIGAWSKQSKWCYRISLFMMFLFVALRNKSMDGWDSVSYEIYFNKSPTLLHFHWNPLGYESLYGYGWGYGLLNSISKTIFNNFYFFQFIDTFLVFILLIYLIHKMKLMDHEKCMFLFVFFCSRFIWYFFVLLRQNIANLICWIILAENDPDGKYTYKHFVKDAILICLAYSFHQTVIIFIPFYILFIVFSRKKQKDSLPIIVIGSAVFISLASSFILPRVINLLANYSGEKYSSYLGQSGFNYINYTIRIVYLLVIYFLERSEKNYELYLNSTAISVLLGAINSTAGVRAVEFFAVGYYGGMGVIQKNLNMDSQRILAPILYLVYIALLLQYIFVNNPALIDYKIFI